MKKLLPRYPLRTRGRLFGFFENVKTYFRSTDQMHSEYIYIDLTSITKIIGLGGYPPPLIWVNLTMGQPYQGSTLPWSTLLCDNIKGGIIILSYTRLFYIELETLLGYISYTRVTSEAKFSWSGSKITNIN